LKNKELLAILEEKMPVEESNLSGEIDNYSMD
jgi:hypothetical protein